MEKIHTVLALIATASTTFAELLISEIDLIGNKVEIVNNGSSSEDLTGFYLCNRLNGSPFYPQISVALIDADHSDTSTLAVAPAQVITLQMTPGFIPDGSGEVGLYRNSSFGIASAMVDYVVWGAVGFRDTVAASKEPPIWESGSFVAVDGIQAGQTIQLGEGLAGNSKDDYSLATSSIGENQVSPVAIKVRGARLADGVLTVDFTGPAGTPAMNWQVTGFASMALLAVDKTADSSITEDLENPGLYQALIDVAAEGASYFVRIGLP